MAPKICVVQINVSDMDKAIEFYCDNLGFKIKGRESYPQLINLENEGVFFILNKVADPTKFIYPTESGTIINIQVENLEQSIIDLKAKCVEFLHNEPQECPVGIYAAIRDPSGNVMELLEFQKKVN